MSDSEQYQLEEQQDALWEQKYAEILKSYLETATQEQLYHYITWRNYDNAEAELDWFINNPNVDRAIILLLYWQLGAGWYVQFSDINEIEANYNKATYQRLLLIEKRYNENYYANHGINYDPYKGYGGKPDDYPEKEVKRPIPEFMLATAKGHIDFKDEPNNYIEGLPLDIYNKINELYNQIYEE